MARVDALLDDPVFFEPYRRHFSAVLGRPSIPIETYLRMMLLKHRYGLGYESLCREVADSLTWTRFCRIPWENRVPYPSTLGKMTNGCGAGTIDALNDVVLSKANDARGRQDGPGPGRHDRGAGESEVSDRLAAARPRDHIDRRVGDPDPSVGRRPPHQGAGLAVRGWATTG